uniref:Uncharacterized protein n=1 Tax=Anopheles funestus TaxID=62324 RepID=A0A182S343_ANOFN
MVLYICTGVSVGIRYLPGVVWRIAHKFCKRLFSLCLTSQQQLIVFIDCSGMFAAA